MAKQESGPVGSGSEIRRMNQEVMWGIRGHLVGINAVSELLTAAARTLNYETRNAETLVASFGDELGFMV